MFSYSSKYYYFEAFLEVIVLFKEHGIIDDDLRCGNSEVNNAVIDCFCRLRKREKKELRLNIYNLQRAITIKILKTCILWTKITYMSI